MKKKYKLPLIIVLIFIIISILLYGSYCLYKKNILQNTAEVIIDDELSINYLNGRVFDTDQEELKVDFSIINDNTEQSMYNIILENIKISGENITYTLKENNNLVINEEKLINEQYLTISSFINIDANDTKSYELIIKNPEKVKISFNLNIQKTVKEDTSFLQTILNNNSVNKETKTKVGEEIAVVDEGIILDIDDNGNTYYFRGNVSNNYISFANFLWRIVRINGDGTVKIILDGFINESSIYENKGKLDDLEKISNNKYYNVLNDWYNKNLKDYDKYISQGKYCIDINKEGENLANYFRINLSNNPTFNCLGKKNNSKIGLLTIDEVIYAGATINDSNEYYYLNSPEINSSWWSMTPAKDQVEGIYYYEVTDNGNVINSTGEVAKRLRPVINLNKNIEVSGTGTKEDPYKLK